MSRTENLRLLFAALLASGVAYNAHATDGELTILETHETQCTVASSTLTNWTETCVIPLYNPAAHSGSVLDEVMVTLTGVASSEVSITATTDALLNPSSGVPPTATNPQGIAGATISAAWSVGGSSLSLDAFPTSAIVSGSDVPIAPGAPVDLADLSGSDDAMLTAHDDDTSIYLDTTSDGSGTFTIDLSANGFGQNPFTSGGNLTISKETMAGASLVVQYKTHEPLPEPASNLMAAFACTALLSLRRRR